MYSKSWEKRKKKFQEKRLFFSFTFPQERFVLNTAYLFSVWLISDQIFLKKGTILFQNMVKYLQQQKTLLEFLLWQASRKPGTTKLYGIHSVVRNASLVNVEEPPLFVSGAIRTGRGQDRKAHNWFTVHSIVRNKSLL